jgi:acetyl esterase/lipase
MRLRFSIARHLRFSIVFFYVLASSAVLLAQQPKAPPPLPAGIKMLKDLEYGRVGERKLVLDLYLPEAAEKPLPLIIWVHGGGWAAGSKDQVGARSQMLRGYAVASVGYRLSGEAIFPAQIQDVKAAVRWLRAHAKEYNLDANHLGAWGSSAGGHLVALLGTSGDVKEFDVGDNLDQSSRVQAVCDYFGPTDLLQMDAHALAGATLKHDSPQSPESKLIGGPIQENKGKAGRVNPIAYITADDPPFLIVHGDQDPLVPHHQSELLFEALKQANLPVRLHTMEGGGHGSGFGGRELDEAVSSFFDRNLKGIDSTAERVSRTSSKATTVAQASPAGQAGRPPPQGGPRITFQQVLAREDANGDSRVTREEFKGPPPLFNRLDRNRDGVLTADDFADAAPQANRSGSVSKPADQTSASNSQPTGLLFFASYPERDNFAAAANRNIVGALHTIYWSSVEPSEGKFEWDDIERRIRGWTNAGKKVALRIMWSSSGNWPEPAAKAPTPQWVLDKGAVTVHSNSSKTDIPLIWDPVYRRYAAKFLQEVARKFDGDPNVLFVDITPAAETNPYRFRRINVQEPEFKTRFAEAAASDGRKYSHELWLDAVKAAVDDAAGAFSKTKLLVTLNVGSLDGPSQMQTIGDYCVSRGCYVGQNGLRGNNYMKGGERASPFLEWDKKTRLYFEMLDATSAGTTGPLMDVMKRAEDIGCDYLGVYSADVLKGTPGQPGFDPEYAKALEYGAQALGGKRTQAVSLTNFKLDGERWTYDDGELSMRGILLKPEGRGPFPAVLISHGLGGSAPSFGLGKAREMVKWGLVCMAPDYTHAGGPGSKLNAGGPERNNYGASNENLKRASKCLDILASLPEVDANKLCAYGHSMGGFVTIGLAAKEPSRLVAAAISGSGIAPRDGFPAPSNAAAEKVKTPFIIFHGSIDNTVRPAQSQSFQEILNKNSIANERHVFEGINHPVDRDKAPEVYGLMRNWFAKYGLVEAGPAVAVTVTPAAQPTTSGAPQGASVAKAGPSNEEILNRRTEWIRETIEARNSQYKTFRSNAIGGDVSYFIYVPAEYEKKSDQRYPVMYWLHGIGGSQAGIPGLVERFDNAIVAGKTPPMLIVFVNGARDSWYCDSTDGKAPVETVIIKDLIPHIDANYRTIAKREGRIVEGFSMGGFGAAHLGFKYPAMFAAVSMLDAALVDLNTMQTRHAALYERIFGKSESAFQAENPRILVEKNADAIRGKMAIRFAAAALAGGNRSFEEQLTKLKIPHDYEAFDVGHNLPPIYDSLGEKNWEFYRRALASAASP